jgi:hypothetical protein
MQNAKRKMQKGNLKPQASSLNIAPKPFNGGPRGRAARSAALLKGAHQQQNSATTRRLAARIARDLFTSSRGRAEELRCWNRDYGFIGGWGEKPMADRIFKHLTGEIK